MYVKNYVCMCECIYVSINVCMCVHEFVYVCNIPVCMDACVMCVQTHRDIHISSWGMVHGRPRVRYAARNSEPASMPRNAKIPAAVARARPTTVSSLRTAYSDKPFGVASGSGGEGGEGSPWAAGAPVGG